MRRIVIRLILALALSQGLSWAASEAARAEAHVRLDRLEDIYAYNADQSYVRTLTIDATLLTRRGLSAGERETMDFYPKSQSLEVLEAWVDQPDGTRLPVEKGSMFTRPSQAAQSAPGFSDSMTTTVLFPQLREGSRTHVKFRQVQKTPPLLGIQLSSQAPVEWAVVEEVVDITLPESVPFHWRTRGPFTAQETVKDGVRRVIARLADQPGQEPERNAVASSDFQPMFLATSLPNLEALGAIYHRQSQDRAVVTPEIAALAGRIVGDSTGLEAVEKIYNWVAINIRYVAVYLDQNDGWIPHAAAEVLARGYGDCKDHVVIMQTLLAARGIESQTGIIDWGTRFEPLPLWVSQFNHVIIYVPAFDLYANPTNPYARLDAIDPRLAGKLVVLATPEGRVARTPELKPNDARYRYDSVLTVRPDGTIDGQARLAMSSYAESSFRSAVASAVSMADLTEQVLRNTAEGGFGAFATSSPRDLTTKFDVQAQWRSPRGATPCCDAASMQVPGGVDVFRPSQLRQFLTRDGQRRAPVMVGARDYAWTTTVSLPQSVEATPKDVQMSNPAGSYAATYARQPGGMRVERRLMLNRTVYRPEEVPALEAVIYAALEDVRANVTLGEK